MEKIIKVHPCMYAQTSRFLKFPMLIEMLFFATLMQASYKEGDNFWASKLLHSTNDAFAVLPESELPLIDTTNFNSHPEHYIQTEPVLALPVGKAQDSIDFFEIKNLKSLLTTHDFPPSFINTVTTDPVLTKMFKEASMQARAWPNGSAEQQKIFLQFFSQAQYTRNIHASPGTQAHQKPAPPKDIIIGEELLAHYERAFNEITLYRLIRRFFPPEFTGTAYKTPHLKKLFTTMSMTPRGPEKQLAYNQLIEEIISKARNYIKKTDYNNQAMASCETTFIQFAEHYAYKQHNGPNVFSEPIHSPAADALNTGEPIAADSENPKRKNPPEIISSPKRVKQDVNPSTITKDRFAQLNRTIIEQTKRAIIQAGGSTEEADHAALKETLNVIRALNKTQ